MSTFSSYAPAVSTAEPCSAAGRATRSLLACGGLAARGCGVVIVDARIVVGGRSTWDDLGMSHRDRAPANRRRLRAVTHGEPPRLVGRCRIWRPAVGRNRVTVPRSPVPDLARDGTTRAGSDPGPARALARARCRAVGAACRCERSRRDRGRSARRDDRRGRERGRSRCVAGTRASAMDRLGRDRARQRIDGDSACAVGGASSVCSSRRSRWPDSSGS